MTQRKESSTTSSHLKTHKAFLQSSPGPSRSWGPRQLSSHKQGIQISERVEKTTPNKKTTPNYSQRQVLLQNPESRRKHQGTTSWRKLGEDCKKPARQVTAFWACSGFSNFPSPLHVLIRIVSKPLCKIHLTLLTSPAQLLTTPTKFWARRSPPRCRADGACARTPLWAGALGEMNHIAVIGPCAVYLHV